MIKHLKRYLMHYINIIIWLFVIWLLLSIIDIRIDNVKPWNFYRIF